MPRPKKSAHLILRRARRDKQGRITHRAVYLIKDGNDQHSTGCGAEDLAGAEKALHDYLVRKHAQEIKAGPPSKTPAWEFPIADAISLYTLDVLPRFTDPGRPKPKQARDFKKRMTLILEFWGDKFVADINHDSCDAFVAAGGSKSTRRRLLEDLRAAVELAIGKEKLADCRVNFKLPPASKPRYRFFKRGEFARLLWTAHRKKGTYTFTDKRSSGEKVGITIETKARPWRHLIPFLLTGAYTGTRADRIENASFIKREGHPWIDLEEGIFYRAWDTEMVPHNKRADPIRIPGRLLAHMRRWHATGATWLVESNGKPVGTASMFFRAIKEAIPDDNQRRGLNRHAVSRHTCATWLMQSGQDMAKIAGYLSMDEKTLKKHYGHHHPDFQGEIDDAITSGRAGKIQSRRHDGKGVAAAPLLTSGDVEAERRRSIADLIDISDGPIELVTLVESTPAAELLLLRERVKRAARSGDWSALLPASTAVEQGLPPPFATETT